ncbi:hypothetical protein F4V43_01450 [Paenibacillus spiritus]|uniref:Nucleotidyltransferase family protein n=1 Tax=Paenibacillus spiritus TaxID=2496557 RepID=A0A5J5GG23_9BACL|nr:hypothetical protein [Paenibacillus spiritus]KAA9007179.1 hypothetical protein F4V43_01450 [Paenibacillus spiritus]
MGDFGWEAALAAAAGLLEAQGASDGSCWLLGGSGGLVLQGVELAAPPRDLDLYADTEEAAVLHRALIGCAESQPEEDYSRGCYSVRSRYRLAGFPLELVGGFEIGAEGSRYRTEAGVLQAWAPVASAAGGIPVRLMPLAHELIFNVLRGRRDRAGAVAEAMRMAPARHLRELGTLIARNQLTLRHIEVMALLLGGSWSEYRRSVAI